MAANKVTAVRAGILAIPSRCQVKLEPSGQALTAPAFLLSFRCRSSAVRLALMAQADT
jgi:hypothetical protein